MKEIEVSCTDFSSKTAMKTFYGRIEKSFHENDKHKLLTVELESLFINGLLRFSFKSWCSSQKPFEGLRVYESTTVSSSPNVRQWVEEKFDRMNANENG